MCLWEVLFTLVDFYQSCEMEAITCKLCSATSHLKLQTKECIQHIKLFNQIFVKLLVESVAVRGHTPIFEHFVIMFMMCTLTVLQQNQWKMIQ